MFCASTNSSRHCLSRSQDFCLEGPFPSRLSPPQIQLGGLGERCILTYLQLSKRTPWQHFSLLYMQCNANDCVYFFGICCSMDPVKKFSQYFGGFKFQRVNPLKYGRAKVNSAYSAVSKCSVMLLPDIRRR